MTAPIQHPISVADVLDRAADLIEPEGKWTQKAIGRLPTGMPVDGCFDIERSHCFCAAGAIWRAATPQNTRLVFSAMDFLRDDFLAVDGIGTWNDAPERTQAEVVAALRSAATAARQQGVGK